MSSNPESAEPTGSRRQALSAQVAGLVRAIRDGDEDMVERAVVTLSQSRRIFAPLAFIVGAFVMLFDGLKLLVSNWRLTLIQILPAMWIWLAMVDLEVARVRPAPAQAHRRGGAGRGDPH